MRKVLLAGIIGAGVVAGSVAGIREAKASKPFTPASKLACAKCHEGGAKGTAKDLTACGKEALNVLKKAGYKPGTTDQAEIKKFADKLKGFKCD